MNFFIAFKKTLVYKEARTSLVIFIVSFFMALIAVLFFMQTKMGKAFIFISSIAAAFSVQNFSGYMMSVRKEQLDSEQKALSQNKKKKNK